MSKSKQIEETKIDEWKVLEFVAPITEALASGDDFVIKGVAINETTTLNNVKYVAEELQKAAASFRDVPILLDHVNSIKNIVGRTTENVNFNTGAKRIEYEGRIMDKDIKEMIKDGRIKNVSIGAQVKDLVEEEDGSMKAIGIHGLEISLVAVPGDNQANLAQAIQNSFKLREMAMKLDEQLNDGDLNMSEEKTETETPAEEAPAKEAEAPAEEEATEEASDNAPEVAAEKAQNINVNVATDTGITEMRKQLDEMKAMLMEKKKTTEMAEEEPVAAEEPADETKGEVSAEPEAEPAAESDVVVESARGGLALYRDYSQEGADTKLKRLVR